MKVIRFGVNDDRLTNHFPHMESAGQNLHIGTPMIGQQRRQVPRMVWMLGPSGIEVAAGHLRFNNHTIFPLKKTHHSAHRWMAAVPANLGDSNGINISLQTITPDSSYAADPSIESIDKNIVT